jgi:hypothetical protein
MIRAKLGISVFAGSCFSDIASAAIIVYEKVLCLIITGKL